MIRNLTILVVLAALAWSGWWLWSAQALRADIEQWFADQRATGATASYSDLAIRGFPNRLDTTFTDLVLADAQGDTRWEAPFFQILQLSYKPGHLIAVFPPEHTLQHDGTAYAISDRDLRASLIFDAETRLIRSNLQATRLTITPDAGRAQTFEALNAALQWVETGQNAYRLALTADSLSSPDSTGAQDLKADLTLHLSAPLRLDGRGDTPSPERIEIRVIEQTSVPMTLGLSGDLDVDDRGRLDGAMSVRADQWRAYLDQRATSGDMADGVQAAVVGALELVSALSGGRDTLEVTIRFDDGQMSIGLIPLGPAPRLRMP